MRLKRRGRTITKSSAPPPSPPDESSVKRPLRKIPNLCIGCVVLMIVVVTVVILSSKSMMIQIHIRGRQKDEQLTNDNDKNVVTLSPVMTTQIHFDEHLIPANSELDVNIGTNKSPITAQNGRHRILIDPLYYVCEGNAKLENGIDTTTTTTTTIGDGDVVTKRTRNDAGGAASTTTSHVTTTTSFCLAISNYTGFSTFYEYSAHTGASSSLTQVTPNTSHGRMKVLTQRTVLVLEAKLLFGAILEKQSTIYKLKLDMQGQELTTIQNIRDLLMVPQKTTSRLFQRNNNKDANDNNNNNNDKNKKPKFLLVQHILAECFCPNKHGLQIFQIDNRCEELSDLLRQLDYETKWDCNEFREWGDLQAYKKGYATDFLPVGDFD